MPVRSKPVAGTVTSALARPCRTAVAGARAVRGRFPTAGPTADRRGQTTLDFAVGVTLFLLVLTSVFVFVSGTLDPFTEGDQEGIVTVNRVADGLSEGLLGDPSRPHVLNATCTVAFFDNTTQAGCRYDGARLQSRVGVRNRQSMNVTVVGNVTDDPGTDEDVILCWDDGAEELVENDACGSGDTRLAIGGDPPTGSGSAVTARRLVYLDGTDVALVVRMW